MKATRKIKKRVTPSKRVAARAAAYSAWKSKKTSETSSLERDTPPFATRRLNLACDGR
jgi:hypothetical protein